MSSTEFAIDMDAPMGGPSLASDDIHPDPLEIYFQIKGDGGQLFLALTAADTHLGSKDTSMQYAQIKKPVRRNAFRIANERRRHDSATAEGIPRKYVAGLGDVALND